MWLMTTRGMVSAVEWHGGEHDGKIVVRARVREHLTEVLALAPAGTATEVAVSPTADYRYRAWITRPGFEKLLVSLSREVKYPNFKNAVPRGKYEVALHSIWAILGRLQPRGPYGTGGQSYPPVPKGEPKPQRTPKRKQDKVSGACDECGETNPAGGLESLAGKVYCIEIQACLARVHG